MDDMEFARIINASIRGREMLKALTEADEGAIYAVARTIEPGDPYRRDHCDRVAASALAIAEALNLGEEFRRDLRHGSWLHDCGKLVFSENVRNCGGAPSPERAAWRANHPACGAEIARLAGLPETVVNIIRSHHERYDGAGYPSGLRGDLIPIEARIVTVADVYDALTSDKPNRRGLKSREAREALRRSAGSQLDPGCVEAALKVLKDT